MHPPIRATKPQTLVDLHSYTCSTSLQWELTEKNHTNSVNKWWKAALSAHWSKKTTPLSSQTCTHTHCLDTHVPKQFLEATFFFISNNPQHIACCLLFYWLIVKFQVLENENAYSTLHLKYCMLPCLFVFIILSMLWSIIKFTGLLTRFYTLLFLCIMLTTASLLTILVVDFFPAETWTMF